ncbi:hypothetical protein AB0N06_26395 [Streptomyces sp. NPDC051020]
MLLTLSGSSADALKLLLSPAPPRSALTETLIDAYHSGCADIWC